MVSRLDGTGEALRSPFPWVALSAALALTAAGWFGIERAHYEETRVRFERRSDSAAAALRSRMVAFEQALRGSAAHLAAAPGEISSADWRRFVAHLHVEDRLPGILSMGYAEVVRRDGAPDMARIRFNDPSRHWGPTTVGFDLAANPMRRKALELARDSGEAAITSRVAFPLDASPGSRAQRSGFMMFVPVYREMPEELPRKERGRAVEGFVFAAFALDEVLRGTVADDLQVLDMRVYDEASGGSQQELVDTRPRAGDADDALFQRVSNFPMPGRNWTLQFLSRPQFDSALKRQAPWGELGGGVLGSVLVFLLVTALMEAWNRTHNLSVRDPLTGLYNRRYLEETMGREVPRAARLGHSVAVIVLDLDHFKRLNDTHGHDAGDFVLMRFAELLRNATRGGDIACRFGGEEFGVVLPGVGLEIARRRADAIRAAYHDMAFEFEGARLGHLTVSGGVAALLPTQQDWAAVLREADRALYAAKQAGRNRVLSTGDL